MDTASLLRLLNEHNVQYVVIGASAFPIYGYARATLDIDIFIKPSPENVQNTINSLKACGYDVSDLSERDMLTHKILLRQYLLETDIHPFVKGVSFEEVWQNKVKGDLNGVPANFASLNDLIKMKRAAGRSKDKEDLKILLKIKKKMKTEKT